MQNWDDVPTSQQEFQIRLMEIYAGFLEHTDVQYGKIVDELEHQGLFDNTLIIYINSDNGPSAEGINGSISELLAQNAMPSAIDQQIEVLNKDYGGMDALGGPTLDAMYHHGWAFSGARHFKALNLLQHILEAQEHLWLSLGQIKLKQMERFVPSFIMLMTLRLLFMMYWI